MDNVIFSKKNEAIVCSAGEGVNALSIVRSLGRFGVQVHVICLNKGANLAAQSRYCTSKTFIDAVEPTLFYSAVREVVKRSDEKPVLYVDNDRMLSAMLTVSEDLADMVLFTSLPEHALKLLDKKDQIAAATEAGLPVPVSWFPSTQEDVLSLSNATTGGLIAKTRLPIVNRVKPFKVLSAPDRVSLYENLRGYSLFPNELFVQEFIEGGDEDVYFALCYCPLNSDHPVVVTGRKLVQSGTGDGGIMVLGETAPNETVRNLSMKMIGYLGYKGSFGIEFKYCKRQKQYFFIEVNMRTERFNALGRLAGIDLNIFSYLDATGQDTNSLINDRQLAGVWIDGAKLLTTLRRRKQWHSILLFLKILSREKEWAIFSFDDLRPFWCSLKQLGCD